MTVKKGAFANSSTGYGKRHNSNSHKSTSRSANSNKRVKNERAIVEEPKLEDDNDLNSGFGDYLRSNEGVEMMKIFVFANTVMMIVTMAWPHFKEQYIWLMGWLDSFKQS